VFTLFQKALLSVVVIGFLGVGVVVWANGANQPAVSTKAANSQVLGGGSANEPPRGIVAIGEASVAGVPTSGYLAFAVQVNGAVGSDIAVQLQTRVDRLLGKALALGVTDEDIVLGPVQFQPQFSYEGGKGLGPAVNSFNAYQQIAIACDEIDGMPLLIQELMKDSAISALSVRYAPSDNGPAYRVARERAIADAREQAAVTAAAAGLRLGPALSVSDYQPVTNPYSPYGSSLGRFPTVGGPGFPPAEIDTVIRVQVQFAIEPAD
jgi:uncharacterized protein